MKYLFLLLFLVSCGNHQLTSDGVVYDCYGLIDKDEVKKQNVRYELHGENMLGVFVFSETLFIPIWNLGFNTYCPVEVMGTK